MSYKIIISKKIEKFILRQQNSTQIFDKLKKLKNFKSKENLYLDIKLMKGNWKGYYRLRIGELRFIFRIINEQIIFVEKADFRGSVYE